MDKNYDPKLVEDKIYQMWEDGGYFKPKIDKTKKPFTITLPPPNVTGSLHAGHAMYVIEDIMVRYHRMLGDPTLWLPGFDHASIAVEYLVTKRLAKEGKNKNEVGREKFIKRALGFTNESRSYIRNQLKKLGFSLDWSKEAYTMDESYASAVKEAFKRLYDKNLIYKGERIINWCPKCQTAISDLENEHQEETGKLYYVKYGPITIATTRPETMFADVAIAVNPKNNNYQKFVGTLVPLPLTNRKIPVIEDDAVDLNFGTGALKITPAHDELDFEIGNRHKLEKLSVINKYGKLTEIAGKYANLKVFEAREAVVNDLQNQSFLEKIEEYKHSVGHCQRCHTITEPIISEQWFVKTETLAKRAIKAVKDGEIKIIPKSFEKIYFNWLNNIRDWCISRQLWWGHKIPLEGENDILDTWFSSGLWPIAVFGWPNKTSELSYFYPTSVRETGYDILFFWVCREIMLCLEMTNQVPFRTVYLHGLIRDEKNKKFSKTAGIGFDPLEMIEKYGADALRMALVFGTTAGKDLHINEDKIRAMRNFTNKIWNAARFTLAPEISVDQRTNQRSSAIHPDDQWILSELDKTTKTVTQHVEKYQFGQAAEDLYEFFWHSFCDKYIEMTKTRREEAQPALLFVLITSLKLLHPFMPFVTEEIWQKMPQHEDKPLIIAQWPK
ncbi:valine--tRNA ligase [Candidatus Shapirobacteria bacterium CG08_land_8_20_14_0_20_39_18]|uniref:valine--tRNA ligase n=1 Tax=Candidatus Shapirobacteria bacterium CG08_land_8_20_14_0_20_39_18 TaxID=1974883 RepID=A0A2M6XCT4_9BACT|nr:MAG: valine--tRNA ligase [Candidatus Shapirobacteria bacterium CG08_land_8_20_14_0_20_39_18]PIY65088.1 MAG: valine--tRNA ligase [Candidatus Shapirobacteria bacterium CG_4_10_14_0_8_um_filter_39_15]